jgi:lipoprotein-releasing system permease protein
MPYELLIGLRYLRAKRRETFISWITAIATLGLVIGVMTLNIVLAVYTGFEEDLRDRILGFNPHLVVMSFSGSVADPAGMAERIEKMPEIVAAAPFVFAQGMLAAGNNVTGVIVRGATPASERVMPLGRYLQEGKLEDLQAPRPANDGTTPLPPLIVGKDAARKLKIGVGSAVNVISPAVQATAVGMVPQVERFVVVGLFDSGLAEYDSSLVYMDLKQAQRFFNLGDAVSGIEVRLDDVYRAPEIGARIAGELGFPYRVRNWIDLNRNLFSALALGKTVYFIVLLLIVLVAAFNIVSTLIMVVMEKRKDIAILKSMGATRRSVRRIFVSKGMLIGAAGTVTGSLAAWGACLLIARYKFIELDRSVYGIDTLQVRIYPEYFLTVAVAALLICWLATMYPARKASRLSPVDVIRYE